MTRMKRLHVSYLRWRAAGKTPCGALAHAKRHADTMRDRWGE